MSTSDFQLTAPPSDPRMRELWLQHTAGFILFQDMRGYALQQIEASLSPEARKAAEKGINDAVYGLMMILDGVTGSLQNDSMFVQLRTTAQLVDIQSEQVVEAIDLFDGDGMCMGYHGWVAGDYGTHPPFSSELG
jgi:hypothetical protein